jgi:hypothetical protein
MTILNRIPKIAQIIPVYAVIVLIFYTWTVLWFFWKYPSWLYFMTFDEILLALAYSLTNCFLESLVVLLALVLLAILLPQRWFYDVFIARCVALILPIAGYMIYIAYQFTGKLAYPRNALQWGPLVLCITIAIAFWAGKPGWLKKALELLAERSTIFIYISLPISIISSALVGIFLFYSYA